MPHCAFLVTYTFWLPELRCECRRCDVGELSRQELCRYGYERRFLGIVFVVVAIGRDAYRIAFGSLAHACDRIACRLAKALHNACTVTYMNGAVVLQHASSVTG